MAADWMSTGRVKLDRAKEQLLNLDAEVRAFMDSRPYHTIAKPDGEPGRLRIRFEQIKNPPLRFGAIAGEIMHHLRSCLDTTWRCAIDDWPADSADPRGGSGGFLISSSAEKFESAMARAVKSPRKEAMGALKDIKPYGGGNEYLCLLHDGNVQDKHVALIPAFMTMNEVTIDPIKSISEMLSKGFTNLPGFTVTKRSSGKPIPIKINPICPVKDPTEILVSVVGGKMDMHPSAKLEVAFGEPEAIKGKPLLRTLRAFLGEVERVIETFARAGLIDDGISR